MKNSGVYLAADIGASSGRVIAGYMDDGKLVLKIVNRFENGPVDVEGSYYWAFEKLKQGVAEGMRKAGEDYGDQLRSIGVDTWGVDYALVDKQGNLLNDPYAYRDSRTDGMQELAESRVPKREQYRINGLQFMFFNTLYQILSETETHPERLREASRLLFMPDLFHAWLSGVQANEYTIASTSGLIDADTRDWSDELLSELNIPSHLFHPPVEAGTALGPLRAELAEELGVPRIRVVAPPGHDTAAAVVGVPFIHGDGAYLSSGTWSLMGIESSSPIMSDKAYEYEFTNEGGVNGTYRVLKNICGLWIIQECKRLWAERGEALGFSEIVDLARGAEPFQHFIMPDDSRFETPGDMEARITEYCSETNQAAPENRAAVVRAIFESLALRYREVLDMLEQIANYRIPVVHIVGGGTQNALLCQYTANAIGRPVTAGPVEATAAGNVLVQMIADGIVDDVTAGRELIKKSFEIVQYEPQDTDAWNEAYQRYRQICSSSV